ncbi:MAG: DNA polymerase I [Clostridiales bacterium]|nr:DNA polymerase I [Clostridiales bacterium]
MEKVLIIDGNSILNRAYYGVSGPRLLMNEDGVYTNAIFGFLATMQKTITEEEPNYIAVTFDLKAPTFRHKKYDGYKANRKGMPEELAMQLPYMKNILKAMNIAIFEKEGYEADDIIGTLAKKLSKENKKVVILTGDRDSFQLVEENINIKLPHTKTGRTTLLTINEEYLKEKYDLKPLQMIELKALMGDSSDNIPGVPGIGEKTGLTLIQKYGSVDNIYSMIENEKQKEIKGKLLENLIENKDKAYLSKELGTICLEVPIEYTDEQLIVKEYNTEELYTILRELELKTFIERFNLKSHVYDNNDVDNEHLGQIEDLETIEVTDIRQIEDIVENIKKEKRLICYFSDKERYEFEDIEIFTFYVNKTVYNIGKDILSLEDFKKYFQEIFENKDIEKIGYDVKKDYIMLRKIGIELNNILFDILIAKYLVDSSNKQYSIKDMLLEYFDINMKEEKGNDRQLSFNLCGGNAVKEDKDEKKYKVKIENRKYICGGIEKLKEILEKELEKYNQTMLFNTIEMPLVTVLGDMEFTGVGVDSNVIAEIEKETNEEVKELEEDIYSLAGMKFNINSPKQLGNVLFEEMKLPFVKKNKSGYSTDIEVLEKLQGEHDIIDRILQYRKVMKIKSTYIDALKQYIVNGRIHSRLNQAVTTTGRLSSTEPNLQNIPVRTDDGKKLRKMFVAKKGCKLIDADYSQIELRVLAHMSNDETMVRAFNNNQDIHTETAMQVFGLKEDEITEKERSAAKAVNFGIVYGISEYGLAQQLKITVKEAGVYIEKYLSKYLGIKEYMDNCVNKTKETGYAETLLNRRRYIPEINSKNFNIRGFGQRVAMNAPVQGTAADIIKIAMINVYNTMKERGLKSKLIMQIHDELIIEAYEDEVEEAKNILIECMENALKLNVPLKVDSKVGLSWYDTK